MKAFKIYQVYEEVGKTPKSRSKKDWVEKEEEVDLRGLCKFNDFDITNLKNLEEPLLELGEAVTLILLSDPDKFRPFFEKRVKVINSYMAENHRYSDKSVAEIILA